MGGAFNPAIGVADLAMRQMQYGESQMAGKRLQSLAATSGANSDNIKLRQVAREFEAMFINQMLQHMSAGIKSDEAFGGGPGEEMFRSMLNQEYANGLSARGGLGIADQVYRQMLAMQEV